MFNCISKRHYCKNEHKKSCDDKIIPKTKFRNPKGDPMQFIPLNNATHVYSCYSYIFTFQRQEQSNYAYLELEHNGVEQISCDLSS